MPSKPKTVTIERLDDEHSLYGEMQTIIANHHPHLVDAKIALCWNDSWQPDADGHCTLGKCRKIGDREKEFTGLDFVIELNRYVLNAQGWTQEQTRALLDHELCHAGAMVDDESGDQKEDDRGRLLWRIRKHDIEEFREIVERHGTYKADLEEFAQSLMLRVREAAPKEDEVAA